MNTTSPLSRYLSLTVGLVLCGALLAQGITEEVPVGAVEGQITLAENGKPFGNALVTLDPLFSTLDGNERVRVTRTDGEGKYRFSSVVAGQYRVDVSAQAHSTPDELRFDVKEGASTPASIALKPVDPYLELYSEQKVFSPNEAPEFKVKGFAQAEDLTVTVYELSAERIAKDGTLWNALSRVQKITNTLSADATVGKKAQSLKSKIENRDAEGIFIDNVKVEPLKAGLYWAACTAGKLSRGTWLNVTEVAMITKDYAGEVAALVTNIETGAPVANAQISVATPSGLKPLGRSSNNGMANLVLPAKDRENVMLVASANGSTAIVDFYNQQYGNGGDHRIFIYTDRPVYRPGDEFQYKAIVRGRSGSNYAVPSAGPVSVELLDPDENVLDRTTLNLSATGSLNGSFAFNKETAPGDYQVRMKYGETVASDWVTVAAYRKPQFQIKVTPEKPFYTRGERGRFFVDVEYYFGGPVIGAEVSASLMRSAAWFDDESSEASLLEGYSYGEEWLDEVTVRTDQGGRAIVEFPTVWKNDPDKFSEDMIITASVSVVDESGKYFDGQGSVRVNRGDFALVATPSVYIGEVGKELEVKFEAYKPGTREATADTNRVQVESAYVVYGRGGSAESPFRSGEITVSGEGGAFRVTPDQPGMLVVRGTAKDKSGNQILAQTTIYVGGGQAWGGDPGRITVQQDKPSYKPGDVAKVLVMTSNPGGTAMVTVEGERLYNARVVSLSEGGTEVEVPITEEFAPNVYFGVAYVKDKTFYQNEREIKVDLLRKRISVKVTPDRSEVQPGETVTYTVETSDDSGLPLPAEVSVGIVDESIYAIAKDRTDIVGFFYPNRYNRVGTSYSFPEIYLDGGDKAPSEIAIRRKFKDTAFWNPTVQTDAQGKAVVSVPLPDNLTSWRATVVAMSLDSRAGMGTVNIRAKKPLMVRLEGPAFLARQDSSTVRALVTNDTAEQTRVDVRVGAVGGTLESAGPQTISVGAGETESVEMRLVAPDEGEVAVLTATASGENGQTDGVELKIPVRPSGVLTTVARAGIIKPAADETLQVSGAADRNAGSLEVTITPSLAASMVDSLQELLGFPYGCVEQTMSRFLPAVVVDRLIKSKSIAALPVSAQLPTYVSEGYSRLTMMQAASGGWGWWENDSADPSMTAYVLEGYGIAKSAGYAPPANSLRRGLDWAQKFVKDPFVKPTIWKYENTSEFEQRVKRERARHSRAQLRLAYVLALHGRRDAAAEFLKSSKVDNADSEALVEAALAWHHLGNSTTRDTLLAALKRKAVIEGAMAHWTETSYGVSSTSRALFALATANPSDAFIPKVLTYLHFSKQGSGWTSTQDTAQSVLAIATYVAGTQELALDGEVSLELNGAVVGRVAISPATVTSPGRTIRVPLAELPKGENRLKLTKTGAGGAYYSMRLTQYLPETEARPSIEGFGVSRSYAILKPQRLEDGTMRLMPETRATTAFQKGDLVRVTLTINTKVEREFVIVEDPIPAGCRITERETPGLYEDWSWWFSKLLVYDDRYVAFARSIQPGDEAQTITYTMRAEFDGTFSAEPTVVYNMYDPGQFARSSKAAVEIR